MSTLYLIALSAFACVFFALVIDTMRSVGRPLVWQRSRARLDMPLHAERREMSLPFVGADRRMAVPTLAAQPVAMRPLADAPVAPQDDYRHAA